VGNDVGGWVGEEVTGDTVMPGQTELQQVVRHKSLK
jgi:hypothetical protein